MSAKSKAGWFVAGLVGLAWINSSVKEPDGPLTPAPKTEVRRDDVSKKVDPAKPSSKQVIAAPTVARIMFTTARVRMRQSPDTNAAIMLTLEPGVRLHSYRRSGLWHEVNVRDRIGWVHGDYLADKEPVAVVKPAAAPPAPVISRAPVKSAPESRKGEPLREPYVGTCDCPYDRKRNGARCGGTSAYSRPGGKSPRCYVGEW